MAMSHGGPTPFSKWLRHDNLNFLRHCLPYLLYWAAATALVGFLAWYFLISALAVERREAEGKAMREAEFLSWSYANHLDRAFEAVDQLILYARYGWETSGHRFRLEDFRPAALLPPQSGFNVSIIGKNGSLLTSTLGSAPKLDLSDQRYFQAHLLSKRDFLYIGQPRHGLLSNRTVMHFTRKLATGDNQFEGIVLVSVIPEHFIAGYEELTLGRNGLLAILGGDRSIRVTRIGQRVFEPEAQAIRMPPVLNGQTGSALVAGTPFFSDHRSRFVGWTPTKGHPMIAIAGIDQEDAMNPYWMRRDELIRLGALATVLFSSLTLVATLFYARLSWRKKQIRDMQATYRTATEHGHDGFFIARPVFNAAGEVTDLELVDCNERGAQLLRHRRGELIGQRVSRLFNSDIAPQIVGFLLHTYVKRKYEGEIQVNDIPAMTPSWVHLTVSRPDTDLAITIRDISDIKAHVAELEKISNEDALTGLPNRHWLNRYLPKALDSAKQSQRLLAILFIDLDGFKAVNDTMGHEAGDELLRNAGRRLKEAVRPHDQVVRIGGDEFVVLLEHIISNIDAAHVAERVLHSFQPAFRLSRGAHSVGTSIGVSVFPEDGHDADTLLKNADMAMYAVKTTGKRNYRFFDPTFSEVVKTKHQCEIELRHALEHDQFVVYYQPRVDLMTGKASSMEALVRWVHPTRGLVEPAAFISLAEETGLIVRLGEQVIDKVCFQLACWLGKGQHVVPVSINVSPRQFNEVNIAAALSAALTRHRVPAHLVEIELTESSMMGNGTEVSEALNAIQKMGVKLLVDDFGTGYSSLSQLQELDFDVLKVDKAFTSRLGKTEASKVFYTAIITMAHSLGMKVVAEGVETLEQVQSLHDLHCDEVQGFYIARPLPPSDTQPAIHANFGLA